MNILDQEITETYAVYNGDACSVLPTIPDASIGLSCYSPPFFGGKGGIYRYSSSERDLSNARDVDEFFTHYDFIVKEIHRATMSGRHSGVHCIDVPDNGANLGGGLIDFPGDIIRLHCHCRKEGCDASERQRAIGQCGHGLFHYVGRYCIWKEPLAVRNRTMAKSLAHKQIVEDSSLCDCASADYLLMFRKKGKNPIPIAHPTGLMNYAGERKVPNDLLKYRGWTGNQIKNRYSHWIWRQYASAFWDDVRLSRVLRHQAARDKDQDAHWHPLQLDVIERCIVLWSNPGETVLSPFGGVGSEPAGAIMNGRKAIAVELKPSYYRQMVLNLREISQRVADGTQEQLERVLFEDLAPEEATEEA